MQDAGRGQRPIYFVSKVLQDVELRYQNIDKATLVAFFTSRSLRHYFQSFSVIVMIDLPVKQDLQKPDVPGRMVKWVVELSEYDISYEPRGPIKGPVYVDFTVELASSKQDILEENYKWIL